MRRKIAWALSTVLICSNIFGTVSLAETGNPQSNTEQVSQAKEVAKEAAISSFVDFDEKGTQPYVRKEIVSKTTVADIGLPTEVKCVLEGSEEAVSVPIQWICREDYTATEKEEYLFDIKLPEGYQLSEELQASVEKKESKLPTARVEIKKETEKSPVEEKKTDVQEEEKAPKAVQGVLKTPRLTPETLPSSESGTYMSYSTGSGSYDIKGAGGVSTTYKNYGYMTALQVGSNRKETVAIPANGKVWTSAGDSTIQIQQKLALVGKNVKVTYIVENTGAEAKTVKYGSYADVKIDGDDNANIVRTDVGMRMIANTGKQFNLICNSGTTPVDTMWFGKYESSSTIPNNVFNTTNLDELLGVDSGLAFSWKSNLAGGERIEKSVLFSVASTPILLDTETEVESASGVIKISQGFKDAAGAVDELHYKLDDGSSEKLPNAVTANGGNNIISGEIPIPSTWQSNTLHKLTIWIYNDSYASSTTKEIDIVYREGGTVVPAQQYTVSFAKGDGASGTVPTAMKDLEAAEITLPSKGSLSKTGYTFAGWSDGTRVYPAGAMYKVPGADITLTAVWEGNQVQYAVQHYQQKKDATGYELKDTEQPSQKVGEQATAVAKSYIGFTENTTHTGRVPSGTVPASGTLVLKLYYDRVSYTVSFDTQGGSGTTDIAKLYGNEMGTLPTVTKPGYAFTGWNDSAQGNGKLYNAQTIVTADVTLYAQWSASEITIDPIDDIIAEYGTAIANKTLSTSGGTGNYKYTVDASTPLPAGITLTEAGVLSGTPTVTTAGEVSIAVNVEDENSGKSSSGTIHITIGKRPLTVSGAANLTKVYDGGVYIAVGALTLEGILSGDSVTASGTAAFVDQTAGSNKKIDVAGIVLDGTSKDLYTVEQTKELVGAITKKSLSVTGATNLEKTYDGTTAIEVGVLTLDGVVAGDTVTATGTAAYADALAGADKTINVTAITLGGPEHTNYKVEATATLDGGEITERPLTVSGAVNLTKVYDAEDTIAVGNLILSNVIAGDGVAATATATFADVNAGTGKTINLTGVTLSGDKKGNYTIADTATLTTGIISARSITVKPKNSNRMVGQANPAGIVEEVITTTSALQGSDTIDGLGTPEFDYAKVKDEAGSYPVSLTMKNANSNYNITCKEGTLTVGQEIPIAGTNYQVTGTLGSESWYTTSASVAPMGDIYDKIVYDAKEVDTIEITDESKEITFALKDTVTGSVTAETTITVKSDTTVPELGEVEVKAKNSSALAEIGRTLTFGHFFKEAVEVSVEVKDAVSGVAKLQYKLPNGTYQDAVYVNGTATFDIPLGTDGTIQIQAFDTAGNQNVESNLTKEGTDVWVTENTAPVISDFTFDKTAQNGWYKEDVVISSNVAEETSGLNNVKVKYDDNAWETLLENPTERTLSYDYSRKLIENGENKVTLKAEDNATNLAAEKTVTVKIDKELPQIQGIAGNPEQWQNKQAEITFKLMDTFSGINEDSVKVMKDQASEIVVTKEGETYHFTTDGNAVYTVVATDKAGNALINSAITVSKIQTVEPTKPDIGEIKNSITIGGDPDNTEGLPTKPDGWYTKSDVEIGLTNPTVAPGQAPQTYYYKVWEEGTDPAGAKEVKFDGTNPPAFEKDGIWNVSIVLKDEAGNKSEPIAMQIKVDSEVPQIENVKGNPDKWQNKEATITVDLKDSVSGIDESTIKVMKDGVEVNVSYKDGVGSFETEGNGNYVITAEDKAGNLVTKTVEVTKIQTTPPEPPKEDEIDNNITIGGDKEETEGLPTTADGWYTKPNVEIGLKNPEAGEGEVPQTYYYKVWEEGTNPEEAKIVAFDGKNPPILAEDGKWNIAIWLEDEAGNKSPEIVKTVKVDTTAPEATTEQDHFVVKQGKEQQAEVKLSDATSGLSAEQVKVTLKGEAVDFELVEADGEYTVTFNTKKGGIYLVESIDEAGNKKEFPITVTAVNSTIKCSEGVSATTNLDALIESMDLSAFKNGETVTLSMDVQEKEARTLDEKVKKGILSLTRADAKMYVLDIRILQHVEDIEGKVVENTIDKLSKPIKITMSIPEAIRGKYNYKIVREHNGKLEVIKSVVSDDGTKIEFESDQFSIYTLTYTDTKEIPKKPSTPVKEVEKPKAVKTGDNTSVMVWAILIIMMPIVIGSVLYVRNKKQRRK